MKKIFFFVSIFTCNYCWSQSVSNTKTLSISVGPSFPVGDFSEVTRLDKFAGYAKAGESIKVSYEKIYKRHIGFALMLYGERNAQNTTALDAQLANTGFLLDNRSFPGRFYGNWAVDKSSWYTASLLSGLAGEWPLQKKHTISLIAKALVGVAWVQSPRLNAASKSDTAYVTVTQNAASAFGFALFASAGIKYRLNRKMFFSLSAEYFATTDISFKNINETVLASNGGLTVPRVYSFSNSVLPLIGVSGTGTNKVPVYSVNLNVGVVWAL